jgi:integrase
MEESGMLLLTHNPDVGALQTPWNKNKLVGPKPPLKLPEIWSIRIRLEIEHRLTDLAMFNLAIDSKLRGCDLVRLKVSDLMHGHHAVSRATVMQRKTQQRVRFELTGQTRDAVEAWVHETNLAPNDYLFPNTAAEHLSTRQYARTRRPRALLFGR